MNPSILQAGWGPLEWAFVGFVVGVIFPFALLLLLQRVRGGDSDDAQVVGPHVVRPLRKMGSRGSYRIYQCKYCGKERERPINFEGEDCEGFEADPGSRSGALDPSRHSAGVPEVDSRWPVRVGRHSTVAMPVGRPTSTHESHRSRPPANVPVLRVRLLPRRQVVLLHRDHLRGVRTLGVPT